MQNRTRKAAAKAAQRKAVVAEKKRLERLSTSLAGQIGAAAPCPVERCLRSRGLFELGIGYVILAKRLPSNLISSALFLVDTFCLGVKDAFHREHAPSKLAELLDGLSETQDLIDIDAAAGRKLLHGAVAYAKDCGLAPARDYAVIERIFGDIDATQSPERFTFGKDGKPFYMRGPRDKPDRVRQILRTLTARFGADGWDHMIETTGLESLGLDQRRLEDVFEEDEEEDEAVLDDVEFQRLDEADTRPA